VAHGRGARGEVRARADDDGVPDNLRCCVCLDALCGRIEQCGNGEIVTVPLLLFSHLFYLIYTTRCSTQAT
jgi:hypothetical protein